MNSEIIETFSPRWTKGDFFADVRKVCDGYNRVRFTKIDKSIMAKYWQNGIKDYDFYANNTFYFFIKNKFILPKYNNKGLEFYTIPLSLLTTKPTLNYLLENENDNSQLNFLPIPAINTCYKWFCNQMARFILKNEKTENVILSSTLNNNFDMRYTCISKSIIQDIVSLYDDSLCPPFPWKNSKTYLENLLKDIAIINILPLAFDTFIDENGF